MFIIRPFIKFWALSAFAAYGWLRLKFTRSPTLIILSYHRVLPTASVERDVEQPGMVVSPQNLKKHIQFIRSLGAVPMHLDEWLNKKRVGDTLPFLSVAFTFDDGWRDNFLHAYPILFEQNVPTTIFLVTSLIDTNNTFWPERVISLLRTPGVNLQDPELGWLRPYLGNRKNKCTPLPLLEVDEIINRLKQMDDASINRHLNAASRLSEKLAATQDNAPKILTSPDLSQMAEKNLVKYGAHTRNHFRLNRLKDKQALEEQIIGCLTDLENMNINSVPIFCYPNGDITETGEVLVQEHYQAACTTKTGWNKASRSDFDLHRLNLHDGNSSSFRTLLATIGRSLA